MILSVDLGNWNVNTSEGNIFPARYTTVENILGTKADTLEYQGIKYFIGEGDLENNYDKANKETNMVLLLYALAIQQETHFKVVVGLPALTYKNSRDTFKERLLSQKIHNVKINSKPKTIIIEDLIVFPEGAGAYYSLVNRPKNCIIIDIGGGTTNIVSFKNGKLDKCTTLGKGMIEYYNRIRDYINSKYTLKLQLEDIENCLREGLEVDGEEINWIFIKDLTEVFIKELMNELRNFDIRTKKVFLTGGGSKIMKQPLLKEIKGLDVLEEYLFSNAKGFKKVGESKWRE